MQSNNFLCNLILHYNLAILESDALLGCVCFYVKFYLAGKLSTLQAGLQRLDGMVAPFSNFRAVLILLGPVPFHVKILPLKEKGLLFYSGTYPCNLYKITPKKNNNQMDPPTFISLIGGNCTMPIGEYLRRKCRGTFVIS